MMDEWMENDPITLFIFLFLSLSLVLCFVAVAAAGAVVTTHLVGAAVTTSNISSSMAFDDTSKYLLCSHTASPKPMVG